MTGETRVWDGIPLDDLTEEETPITYGVVKPGEEGEVPFVRGGDIAGGRVLMDQLRTIGRDVSQQYRRTLLRGGEILVSLVGNPGQIAIAPPSLAGANIARQVGLVRLKPGIDSRFVSYFLQSRDGQTALGAQSLGSVQQVINLRDLKTVKVPLPPLAEQKAIAAVLGALDDKIELNRRMNATLEAMARALFQSWFVDFDPVRAKLDGRQPEGMDAETAALFPNLFQESPLGHIPANWKAVPLYDTAQWVNGAAFNSSDFCDAGYGLPVIKIAELKNGITSQTKWSQRGADPGRIIDNGDLLYSWSGSPDTSLEAFLWSGGRGLVNQHIFKVISPTVAEKRFVYYLLQYLRPVLVETARNKQTTGLGHVTVADMKRLLVCLPSKEALAAFDRAVSPIFDKAFNNTLESRTLATLRDTLLPKLLSGEITTL